MPRFDVFRDTRGRLLLDVQTDLLPDLVTRLVVPLLPAEIVPSPIKRLQPILLFNGRPVVMATQLMAAVPVRGLGRSVGSLDDQYDTIKAALDMIFLGF